MDWRVVAAGLAALGVLTGGTLLAAQVESDLGGVDGFGPAPDFGRTDGPPLQPHDLKLPRDVPVQLPQGAKVSPDLSSITLPNDLDLQVPDDLDLGAMDLELPEDFSLDLPAGTQLSPPGLTLPDGATLRLPDGRRFELPAGSTLDLPPEVLERLMQQGLPAGTLPEGRSFDLQDLPPDLVATLDPPAFDGAGHLKLPAGTTIRLPEGQTFPYAAGALALASRYLLPAGTTFDIPFGAGEGGWASGEFPVPQPYRREQLQRPGVSGPRVAVETEITGMPSRARKGEPFVVSGYVRERDGGSPVVGAPVDVFLNETKDAPGVLVGQGTSDSTGTFRVRVSLPADKPATRYQLVNHAAAFLSSSGRVYDDAWGDPPLATYASTTLTLDAPEREGAGAPATITGTLLDHTGAPVEGATILVSVDRAVVARPFTDATGRFLATPVLAKGTRLVEARYAGSEHYEPSAAAPVTVLVDDWAIETPPVVRATHGDAVTFSGRVLHAGVAQPSRALTISLPSMPPVTTSTDATGRFSATVTLSDRVAPGAYVLNYTVPDTGATKRQTLEVNLTARILLDAPSAWDVERSVPLGITLVDADGRGVAGQPLRIHLSGPGGAKETLAYTDASGSLAGALTPLRASPGVYTLRVEPGGTRHLQAVPASQTIEMGLFEVRFDMPRTLVRGQDFRGAAWVTFAGRPFAHQTVHLDFLERHELATDANGHVEWTAPVHAKAPLGETSIALSAPDHPQRLDRARIFAVPEVLIQTVSGQPDGTMQMSVRVRDDLDQPLPNARVEIIVRGDGGDTGFDGRANSQGYLQAPLDKSAFVENATMRARVVPEGDYLAAEDVQTWMATTPRAPFPTQAWLALPIALGIAALGAGGWYGAKLLRARPRRGVVVIAPTVAGAPVLAPADVEARFLVPEGEPDVWGLGEPIALRVANRGASGTLAIEPGRERLSLPAHGEGRVAMRFHEEGEVVVRVRREGASGIEPAEARLRVVEYRKEIAREFDALVEKARALDPAVTTRSTPREVAWALAARLDGAADAADEVALLMESTNYSQAQVGRAHYLRFVAAARALDARLAPAEAAS